MNIKKAVLISALASITIGLIAIGIKTGSFKNKNNKEYKPKLLSRNSTAIRVDAEDLYTTSKKWLWNDHNVYGINNQTTINFTSWSQETSNPTKTAYTTITKQDYSWGRINYQSTGPAIKYDNNTIYQYVYNPDVRNPPLSYRFLQNASRIIEFETEPTGDLYSNLNNYALPAYNSDILLFVGYATRQNDIYKYNYFDSTINEIRKSNLQIQKTDVETGKFLTTDGTIQLFLDAGCSSLKINGTEYIGSGTSTINITNNDIIIQAMGTHSGNTSSIFTINYFNTRPPITPQPYPDPGEQIVEIIDLKPLMLNILTMPFTFITQAFNITLWPNTPYEFNFSQFIMAIIAIATILFIIRLFTSGFSVIGNYTNSTNNSKFKKSQTRLNNAKAKNIENNTPRKNESHVTIKKEN